jgi:hypothetical protein
MKESLVKWEMVARSVSAKTGMGGLFLVSLQFRILKRPACAITHCDIASVDVGSMTFRE